MDSQTDSQPSQSSVVTIMEEDRHEILYFAFGSNLSTEQMLRRCPSSTPIGLGHLPGMKWIINSRGYANVVADDKKDGVGIYGLLYLLPPQDEDSLDMYENVPWAYNKFTKEVTRVTNEKGQKIEGEETLSALVYIDVERTTGDLPNAEYVVRMETGIKECVEEWGMGEDYAASLREWLTKGTK